ncbi:YczE/YyaS/YitT family protein [Calidifontibacter terrae]
MSLLRRTIQLPLGCIVLGFGVALLLTAKFGSDGYSTLMSGLTDAIGLDFAIISWVAAAVLVALAWSRGQKPGPGTICQLVVVGLSVSLLLKVMPDVDNFLIRLGLFAAGYVVLCIGVAAYLATDLGAGPTEAAALAFDPPLPFRWSYTIFQGLCVLIGWLCGATVGVGTIILAAGIGWSIDRLMPLLGTAAEAVAHPVDTPVG